MTPKDVIAQADKKLEDLWYDEVECPHHEGELCDIDHYTPLKSFLSSYTKDLLLSLYEQEVREMEGKIRVREEGSGKSGSTHNQKRKSNNKLIKDLIQSKLEVIEEIKKL